MPDYNANISPEELSGAISQTNVNLQRVSSMLDQMSGKFDRISSLMGKFRDFTRDELQEMREFRDVISGTANQYRQMYSDRLRGMNDMSVALKAFEDRIQRAAETEKKAIEENKRLRERSSRLEEATTGKINKEKAKILREELGMAGNKTFEARRAARMELEVIQKKISANQEIVKSSRQELQSQQKNLEVAEKIHRSAKLRIDEEEAHPRRRRMSRALEIASDANLPGVSQAATIGKYAGLGAEGGLGALGLVGGGLMGAGVVAAGYTALQGYRAYNLAHQMAPLRRTLAGQMGPGSSAASEEAIRAYGGYGGLENLQLLSSLNRGLGGVGGMANLRGATDIANRFGLGRDEVGGLASSLFQAGGSSPQAATKNLESIMIEGVRAGMDRARITQFTQEVVGIQAQLLRTTGQNNAEAVSRSLGQLMRASGRGEQFLRGPEMAGIQGIDSAVRGAGHLGGGGATATLMRAFGFGAGGPGDLVEGMQTLQRGIFGQKNPIEGLQRVFGQYRQESGGDQKIQKYRMMQELGLSGDQIDALQGVLARSRGGKAGSKEDAAILEKIKQESQDPMSRLLDIEAKSGESLARLAGSDAGIAAVVAIDEKLLDLQKMSVNFLGEIASALTGKTYQRSYDLNQENVSGVRMGAAIDAMVKGEVTPEQLGLPFRIKTPKISAMEATKSMGIDMVPQVSRGDRVGRASSLTQGIPGAVEAGADQKILLDAFRQHARALDKNTQATELNTRRASEPMARRGNTR